MSDPPARPARGARRGAAVLVGVAGALGASALVGAVVERALRDVGATAAEIASSMPGDGLLARPSTVSTRAVTIAGSPAEVWPWIVQLGWGRAGWYAVDLLERPLGAARSVAQDGTVSWRSLDDIAPRHQDLGVGDLLPMRAGIGLRVVQLATPSHLVAVLDRILTDRLRLTWTWTLVLREERDGTRLVARTRTAATSAPVDLLVLRGLLGAGHALMELVQLRGIRRRVERTS